MFFFLICLSKRNILNRPRSIRRDYECLCSFFVRSCGNENQLILAELDKRNVSSISLHHQEPEQPYLFDILFHAMMLFYLNIPQTARLLSTETVTIV